MDFSYTETQTQIRSAVKALCDGFGPDYWRQCAQDGAYPEAFVDAMIEAGWLAALWQDGTKATLERYLAR